MLCSDSYANFAFSYFCICKDDLYLIMVAYSVGPGNNQHCWNLLWEVDRNTLSTIVVKDILYPYPDQPNLPGTRGNAETKTLQLSKTAISISNCLSTTTVWIWPEFHLIPNYQLIRVVFRNWVKVTAFYGKFANFL